MHVGLAYQNGVQIELIQQVNDVVSPYRFFYDTANAQTLHQLSYIVPDLDAALARAATAGLCEHGVMRNDFARYVYLDHPAINGLVVELMQSEPNYWRPLAACAAEAAQLGRKPSLPPGGVQMSAPCGRGVREALPAGAVAGGRGGRSRR